MGVLPGEAEGGWVTLCMTFVCRVVGRCLCAESSALTWVDTEVEGGFFDDSWTAVLSLFLVELVAMTEVVVVSRVVV